MDAPCDNFIDSVYIHSKLHIIANRDTRNEVMWNELFNSCFHNLWYSFKKLKIMLNLLLWEALRRLRNHLVFQQTLCCLQSQWESDGPGWNETWQDYYQIYFGLSSWIRSWARWWARPGFCPWVRPGVRSEVCQRSVQESIRTRRLNSK